MANKFIDQNGLRYFFSKIKAMLGLKANVSDLKPVATSGSYNDLTDKTHWAEVGGSGSTTIILEERSIEVDGDGIYGNDTVLSDYALGDMVNVDWDGTTYVCEIKSFSEGGLTALYCGSEIQFNEDYAGNEPFVIYFNLKPGDGTEGWGVISIDQNSGTHTIKIYKDGSITYHKLDNHYLNIDLSPVAGSNNLATSGAVYKIKKELDEDVIKRKNLDTSLGELSSDNNVPSSKAVYNAIQSSKFSGSYNDLTDRTHWKETSGGGNITTIVEEQTFAVDSEGIFSNGVVLTNYSVNDVINVKWDGVIYPCIIKEVEQDGHNIIYCGSEKMFNEEYTGSEPFYVCFNTNILNSDEAGWGVISMDAKVGTHTIKIYKGEAAVTTYHKLDSNYLNVDAVPTENSNNPISSDAAYKISKASGSFRYLVNATHNLSAGTVTADKTFSEIKEAISSGYNVEVVDSVGINYKLLSDYGREIWFIAFNEEYSIKLVCSETKWEFVQTELVRKEQGSNNAGRFLAVDDDGYLNLKDATDTTISSESTDAKMPSSKCVYDAIENVKGTIPSVSDWAKQSTKPTYTASEVGADASGTAASAVSSHNTNTSAHNDMRLLIKDITDRLNALADSDDTTLDQMSEIVAYIKNNKSLIDNITTSKVSIADIINNLTTNVTDKPLSAAQGVALKALIDAITVPTALSQLSTDATHRTVTDEEKAAWNGKSNFSGSYNDLSNKPNIVIGDKAYKIVVSSTAPTVDDRSVITLVTG